MKIAFVYDAVYPWVKGGAEKRIYELGKRLASQGNEIHVFGVKWWEGDDIIKKDGMQYHGVCKPMELYINGRRSISEAIIFSIHLVPHLIREKFDVIDVSAFPYFSCFSAKFVSLLKRTPVVITWLEVWGEYWYQYLGWKGFFGKIVERLVSSLPSESIAISGMTEKNLKSLGSKSFNIHVLPIGVDLKKITDIPESADECDIIFVGRFIREKNVDVLLEAVSNIKCTLPEVKCTLIGNGPEKKLLMKMAEERSLLDNVKFMEFMEHEEVIARVKSSKVLVLPSSREGFGMVVVEAFACGIPVITVKSPLNAASLLVNEETGFVVDLESGELSEAIRKLLTDSGLREKMSASALKAAQVYDWDSLVEQLTHLYGGMKR